MLMWGRPPSAVRSSKARRAAAHSARESFAGNQEVLTFTLSGLSKISALPQMKVSWVVTSGPGIEVEAAMARLEVIADTYLSMNAPIQWAVPVLMEERKNVQRQLLERVKENLAELDRQLAGQKSCQRLQACRRMVCGTARARDPLR